MDMAKDLILVQANPLTLSQKPLWMILANKKIHNDGKLFSLMKIFVINKPSTYNV